MALKNYFVMWAAQRQNGTVAAPVESFEEERAARATWHTRCANAANGDNLKDTVVLMNAEGFVLESDTYEHAPVEQAGT